MHTNSMTEIIYDYFSSRIKFGYFTEGEQLPSIPKIRKQFGVSALTVRAALQLMKEHGYIETSERTPATVIFKPDEKTEKQYVQYFLSHKEGIDDICCSSDIIFKPIIQQYFQRYDKASIKRMRTKLEKADLRTVKPVIMFYAEAMQPLNNSLIINLHWEMARYLSTPYLHSFNFEESNAQAAEHINVILDLLEAGQFQQAAKEAGLFNENVTHQFHKRIHSSFSEHHQIEQIPFKWHIYREHPQLCYTLAADIMSKIDQQVYKQGDLLPSCKALSLEYQVSFITARRTVALLNDMCITESINGVGARVISENLLSTPDFSHLQIRRSLVLYLQAMQICSLTCEYVAVHTLSALNRDSFQVLEQEIQTLIDKHITCLTGETCLRFIGENNPSPFVKEVYNQLYHLMLWGHSLHIFFKAPESNNPFNVYTVTLIESLNNGDIQGFAKTLAVLLSLALKSSKMLLLQLGFDERQLI